MDTRESCQVTAEGRGAGDLAIGMQVLQRVTEWVWSILSQRIAYVATFHAVSLFRVHAFRWWLRKRA